MMVLRNALIMAALVSLLALGCSAGKTATPQAAEQTPALQGGESTEQSAPAHINISYEKPTDTLQSVTVSEFTGASVLTTRRDGDNEASVIRFDGGVPVWKFHANRSLLNPLSAFEVKPARVEKVDYGKLPSGFIQDVPDTGPPAPLDAGGFYIFSIERASGATDYQAVKVNADQSLQAYDAEPRAGTSYKLCCNVSSDFAQPSPSLEPAPEVPSAEAPPIEGPGSGFPEDNSGGDQP